MKIAAPKDRNGSRSALSNLSVLKRMRLGLASFLGGDDVRAGIERGDWKLAEEIERRIEAYEAVVAKNRPIAETARTEGFQILRQEIMDRTERDLQKLPDQVIRMKITGDNTAFLNALEQKLTRGFFGAFEQAAHEDQLASQRKQAELDKLHELNERITGHGGN